MPDVPDVPPDMLNYAAALGAASAGVGPFGEEDDDDYVREEVDSSEDEGGDDDGLDQRLEKLEATILGGTGGVGFGEERDGAGAVDDKKGAPEAALKRGRQRRPSAKAVLAAAAVGEEEGHEMVLGAEALLPLPFAHGTEASAGGRSSGRGGAKRSRSTGGSASAGGSNRKSGKLASTPAQSR